MADENLEEVIDYRVKPMLDSAMRRYLGVTVNEIRSDISDKLRRSTLLDPDIDISMKFKDAKKKFKSKYFSKLLRRFFGNVSAVADAAGVDRRSVHRHINEFKIEVERFRQEMLKLDYLKEVAVSDIIETTLDEYKQIINPEKMGKLYDNVSELSKEIIKELPETLMSLDEAEIEFERAYIKKALDANKWNITKTAKKIGLRYETLHRKITQLGLRK